jgi:hypothetical protein
MNVYLEDQAPSSAQQAQDTARPRFYLKPKHNKPKSLAEGRPIFDDAEYVEIHAGGDKLSIPNKPVTEEHRRRWPRQYAAFKNGQNQDMASGTPLSEWPSMSRSQVEELAYFKIFTVEQLANASDGNLQMVGPLQSMKSKAKDFLEKAKGNAPIEQMRAELGERDNLIATMQQQLKDQADDLAQLKKAKSK